MKWVIACGCFLTKVEATAAVFELRLQAPDSAGRDLLRATLLARLAQQFAEQQAGRSNSTHICILVKVTCDIHTRAAKLRVEDLACRFPRALSLTDPEELEHGVGGRWGAQ
jgi:hypothetical protein